MGAAQSGELDPNIPRYEPGEKVGQIELADEFVKLDGLLNSAKFIVEQIQNGDMEMEDLFELLGSDQRQIRIPIFCFCRLLGIQDDEMTRLEVELLTEEIGRLQKAKKLKTSVVGLLLDKLFEQQQRVSICHSLADLRRLIVLLKGPAAKSVLFELGDVTARNVFWKGILSVWMDSFSFGLSNDFSPEVAALFLSSDLSAIHDALMKTRESDEERRKYSNFLQDLGWIQKERPLSPVEWQKILGRRSSEAHISCVFLHALCLQRVVLKWLHFEENLSHEERCSLSTEEQIASLISRLFIGGKWSYADVRKLFRFKTQTHEEKRALLGILDIIYEYSLDSGILANLPDRLEQSHLKELTAYVAKQVFGRGSKELSVEEAILCIAQSAEGGNHENIEDELTMSWTVFEDKYDEVKRKCGGLQGIKMKLSYARSSALSNVKRQKLFGSRIERIAAAVFAVDTFFSLRMRPVQILALLLARKARKLALPRILQMQTGEGKTFVVAALAVFEVFEGNLVDVVTSSSELAENQWRELKGFYDSVGIVVEHNAKGRAGDLFGGDVAKEAALARVRAINAGLPDPGKVHSTNQVYMADVVYGSAEDFMADVLREEFEGSGLRFKRNFQVAIVDEVDNMFIDGRNDSVRLSSKSPGMGNLLGVKSFIWQQTNSIFHQMGSENGKWFYKCDDNELLFENESEVYEFVRNGTVELMEKVLRFRQLSPEERGGDQDFDLGDKEKETKLPFPHLNIPPYLKSFVETQLPKWVDSAIKALFFMKPGFDYIVSDDKIVVVDAANTGVHHPTMQWSHGLHQFLQMKHGLELHPEALPTNFLSNVAFFLRYKTNLIGLTGTIGGESSRKFLHDVYGVDFMFIPPFRERRHQELAPQICADEETWIETVARCAVNKLTVGRAVLLITPYIHHAHRIYASIRIEMGEEAWKVKLYTSREGSTHLEEELLAGNCIVATNIAGRGTDLKVSQEVQEMGGMHVLLATLPDSDRVERQNIGRTSRTGQPGTSQIILNLTDIDPWIVSQAVDELDSSQTSSQEMLNSLRRVRDRVSLDAMAKAIEALEQTKKNDEALQEYISIRQKKMLWKTTESKELQKVTRQSLDATFGRHLAVSKEITKEDVNKEFSAIGRTEMLGDPKSATLYAQTLMPASPGQTNFESAKEIVNKAVELDGKFSAGSRYFRAALSLDEYAHGKGISCLTAGIRDFEAARESLREQRLQYEMLIQSTAVEGEGKTLIMRQMERRIIVIDTIIANIDTMVGRSIESDLAYLEAQLKDPKCENKEDIEKQKENLLEHREEIEKGTLKIIEKKKAEIKIKPISLTESLPPSEIVEDFEEELEDFKEEGLGTLLIVNERPPINWWAIAAIGGAAALQIVGGISAAIFTVGAAASVGWAMLQEGIGDAIYAIRNGIIERNISWVSYGIRKAISLAITFATFGIGAIKSAAKGMTTGLKGAWKILTGTAERVTEEGWKLAVKATAQVAIKQVAKVVVSSTFDNVCADKLNGVLASTMESAASMVLKEYLSNDRNLKQLLALDEKNGNNRYAEMFADRVLGPLRTNHSLLKELREGIRDVALRGMEGAGYETEANICKRVMQGMSVTGIALKLKEHFEGLPEILSSMVREYAADEKTRSVPTRREENRGYVRAQYHSVEDFVSHLSKGIGGALAPLLTTTASNFIISGLVEKAHSKVSQLHVDIANYREKFVDSSIVIKSAQEKLNETTNDRTREAIELIKGVAGDKPGDIIQAEYLAEVVEQPIEIETVDSNGEKQVITIGDKFSLKAPIRLKFERPSDGGTIGHYCLADGTPVTATGENSCLMDAVAQATKYDSQLLKRATANVMLNRLESVEMKYANAIITDIYVGGKINRPSKGRTRHVRTVTTLDALQTKIIQSQQSRGPFPAKSIDIIDDDSSEFDDLTELFYNAQNPPPGVDVNYVHRERMIFKAEMGGKNNPNRIEMITAYRGEATFKVNDQGAQHLDWKNIRTTKSYTPKDIYKNGDMTPGSTNINDLL